MSESNVREVVNCVRTLLKTRGHTLTKKEISALIDGHDISNPVALTDSIVATLGSRVVDEQATAKRRGKIPTVRREVESFVRSLPNDLPGHDVALKILARYVVKPKQKDEDLSIWQDRVNSQISYWQNTEVEAETATGDIASETAAATVPEVAVTTEYNL
jgi:hypothetical protein